MSPPARRVVVVAVVAVVTAVGVAAAALALGALRRPGAEAVSPVAAAAPRVEPEAPAAAAATPPDAGIPPAAPAGLGVTAVEGVAERHRGEEHHALAVGDIIERSDWITTGRTSSVSLRGQGGATLQVASSTRVRLDEADRSRAGFTLDRGRVRAASPAGTVMAVRAADGRAAVESSDAEFTVQAEPGVVRVVPHTNRVTLLARNERLAVEAGSGAVVAGEAPPVLAPVPRSLLLKVRWPEAGAQRTTEVRVEGETAPGATVRAGAAEAVADGRGRFTLAVPLHDGPNRPRLTSEDLAGRRATSMGQPILVDRSRPAIERGGVRYQP